jgi:hypothetical protein
LQINDLPEFYVERGMGIENVGWRCFGGKPLKLNQFSCCTVSHCGPRRAPHLDLIGPAVTPLHPIRFRAEALEDQCVSSLFFCDACAVANGRNSVSGVSGSGMKP